MEYCRGSWNYHDWLPIYYGSFRVSVWSKWLQWSITVLWSSLKIRMNIECVWLSAGAFVLGVEGLIWMFCSSVFTQCSAVFCQWVWKSLSYMSLRVLQFSSVQSLSHVRLFVTPWIAACQASLSITKSRNSLRLTSIELVMPSSHLILCRPLLLLPLIPPSIKVFSNESTLCMRWPKYWSFSFSIIPSKEIPELISFRMDWLDLLVV